MPLRLPAAVLNRVIAKFMDLFIILGLGALVPFLGALAGLGYSLLADGMDFGPFKSQSFGKKVMNLRVRNTKTQSLATYRDSAIRNAPVGVVTFFMIFPPIGWILSILIGVPLLAMEVYLMMKQDSHARIGDTMADTEVVELPSTH